MAPHPAKQTYRYRQCLHHLIPGTEHTHETGRVKNLAVSMYAGSSCIEAISRLSGTRVGTVYSWIRKATLAANC